MIEKLGDINDIIDEQDPNTLNGPSAPNFKAGEQKKKMGPGLYTIKNIVTNKFLVGSTKNLATRKSQHFSYLKSGTHPNPHLQASYNKYGKENFIWETVTLCNTIKQAREAEQYWLNVYWHFSWQEVYNCNKIADPGNSTPWTEERKKKHSISMKLNNPMNDYKNRQKISLSNKGNSRPDLSARNKKYSSKPVYQKNINSNDIITKHPSVREAARRLGKKPGSIYNNCSGATKTAYGFKWSYIK